MVNKTLGENQWRCIPNFSIDIVALVDEFIMEIHRLTYRNILKIQNDVKVCFDGIINSHAILTSRKLEVSDEIFQLYSTTLYNTKYRTQPALGTTQCHYQHNPDELVHHTGQGSGSSSTHWVFISVPMMDILEQCNKGCTIHSLNKKITRKKS